MPNVPAAPRTMDTPMLTRAALPTYIRPGPRFEDAFAVPASSVIRSMDDARDDVVEHAPGRGLALRAGCVRERILVHIDDPFGSSLVVPCVCTVHIESTVPRDRRGLHMSRVGDALARLVQDAYPDVGAFAGALADAIDRAQYGGPSEVTVDGTVSYLEELPLEGTRPKVSLEQLGVVATYRTGAQRTLDAALRVSHMVACPCVQETRRHARLVGSLPGGGDGPEFTHSQRCETTVTVRGAREWLNVPRVLAALDAVLVRTMNTLPRGSELLLVYRAHRSPQFVEDAARDAAWVVYRTLESSPFNSIEADSRSSESIHDFDLAARVYLTAEEARRCQ